MVRAQPYLNKASCRKKLRCREEYFKVVLQNSTISFYEKAAKLKATT